MEFLSEIGLSINGLPKIGIIHKPFFTESGSHSRTYFGSIETGTYFIDKKEYMSSE